MKSVAVYLSGPRDDGALESLLKGHAIQLGLEVVEVYRDDGVENGHPQLDRMLKEAGEREFAVIVVNGISDLARFPGQLIEVLGRLMELGVGLISRQEELDTTTIEPGAILKVITAVVDMQRRAVLSTVTKRRKDQSGRPTREVDTDEARWLRDQGLSFGQLSELTGIPKGTLHGKLKRKS